MTPTKRDKELIEEALGVAIRPLNANQKCGVSFFTAMGSMEKYCPHCTNVLSLISRWEGKG